MRTLFAFAITAIALPAAAQPPAIPGVDPAPWWMSQPIMASAGYVEQEMMTNRATFTVEFLGVADTPEKASRLALDKAAGLGKLLAGYGAQRAQIEARVALRPIYEQYRDREGNRIPNRREDKIENYAARVRFVVTIRDFGILENAYRAGVAADPTDISSIEFTLEPDNAVRTELANAAIRDARQRAEAASAATGARLGAVKLIDPTGRACQTDVLVAGAPRTYGPGVMASRTDQGQSQAGGRNQNGNPVPAAMLQQVEIMTGVGTATYGADAQVGVVNFRTIVERVATLTNLPIQPPMETVTATACVIYALN